MLGEAQFDRDRAVAELYAGAKGRGLADQDYAAVAAYLASMAPLLEHPPPEQ